MTIRSFYRSLARLSGLVGRKRDGEAGQYYTPQAITDVMAELAMHSSNRWARNSRSVVPGDDFRWPAAERFDLYPSLSQCVMRRRPGAFVQWYSLCWRCILSCTFQRQNLFKCKLMRCPRLAPTAQTVGAIGRSSCNQLL